MFSILARRLALAASLLAWVAPALAQAPAPVPALPDAERRTTYSITGTTCACAVNFALYGDSSDYGNWVEVWLNGTLIPSSNYTITSPSGSLATLPRPISDAVLTFNQAQTGTVQIVGARRPRRISQFAENRGVAARDLNQAVTDIVAMLRENWDKTNDVTGRAVLAPPGETLAILASAASRASSGACFDASGNLVSCVSIPSTTFTAGNGIAITGTSPKTITSNIQGSGPITITGTNPLIVGCSTCNTTPSGTFATISSRATATTLDLSAYSVVQTLGYAAGGDGGGATFKKVAAGTSFIDQYIATGATTNAGSAYTNGSYLGVPFTSGSGGNCNGAVTIAGGAVTNVFMDIPCPGYKVGDVLTTPNSFIGGTGSGFAWTVSTLSTLKASFVDSAGNRFQYVTDQAGVANALQFGCKGDWAGVDGSATNNSPCLWSALAWANYPNSGTAASGSGAQVVIPRGAYMTCGAFNSTSFNFLVPRGVRVSGTTSGGTGGTVLVQCAADSSGTHYIGLCDPVSSVGQFGCKVENLTLYLLQVTTGTSGIAALYSNSGQQFVLAENVEVDAGNRSCVKYETGTGGAANDIWIGIDCVQSNTATNAGFSFNASGVQHILERSVCASGPAGAAMCIENLNGRLIASGIDIEGYVTGFKQNVSTSGNISSYKNVQEQSGSCTQAIQLSSTNTPGNIVFENIATGCPTTIANGQSGGASFTGNIVKQITCVSGACN